jgi:isocitrate dehydrogenase kinase/phosphatase
MAALARWARHPLHEAKAAAVRRKAWRRLFPPGAPDPREKLPPAVRAEAAEAAGIILGAHRRYLARFNGITAKAQETFETRAWIQGALHAAERVRLYRDAVDGVWLGLERAYSGQLLSREFWLAGRRALLETVFDDYDADLALTFFYSTMRLAFDRLDAPVEYADDGLAERSHVSSPHPATRRYRADGGRLSASIAQALADCAFRAPFRNLAPEAGLAAGRMLEGWRAEIGASTPRHLEILRPVFFRDQEAYIAGKLWAREGEMPVVLALRNDERGIALDAVLTGKEDMRNILFVSTRSTFHVLADEYREVLAFLDSLAPERGHPAMCAVLGFTHPARVALNQRLRDHLARTRERFARVPGREGMAMVVFGPPGFPYVFKVIRDFSAKQGWTGRQRIMDVYRWVHEINRGRLMLDAWIYRNLRFPRDAFEPGVLQELLSAAPQSVRLDGDAVILKDVYAQRRVRPLNTFFEEEEERALRERAADALGCFIKDLASMGLFVSDCYGLTFNLGLTHGFNAALFDFDDLGSLLRHNFRETPPMDEKDELLWNPEVDGPWFAVAENDVLVDEWERFLGVPLDLQACFREKHGDLFTTAYWTQVQRRILSGEQHYVLPYPQERRLSAARQI